MKNDTMGTGIYRTTTPSLKHQWRQLGVHNYIRILIIAGLFCFLFRNEIEGIVNRWLADSSWSHGFLIPLFSLYFVNQKREEILRCAWNDEFRPNYLGLVFLVFGILFYPFNIVHLQYGYLRSVDMIASLGAIVLFLGGWKLVKHTWLPIVFLIFAVPLPERYYRELTIPMRQWAATVASHLLDLVPELEATAGGVVIDVFYKGQPLNPPLDVAEACSGMRLLMAFLALGVAMAYLHYRPLWQRIILLVSTVPIAIFCNIVRVTVTGFIYVLIHPKYAQGIYHDMLGMAMLPLAFGLYGALAWFMSSLFIDESDIVTEDIVVRKKDA
ncbi:MAG: exosortase/archaeosortase family protein [Planctomycetota bacterium]